VTLRIFGFNTDFAPVVDILDGDRTRFSNGIQSRAFPGNQNDVTELASSFLNALQAGGITGCLKHFPGLGASEVDSHRELPRVSISEDELASKDLHPYRSMFESGDVRAVMVAHAAYPNTRLQEQDQNGKLLPSSLSPAIISNLLRGELGFDGLVLTDDLEMGAIVENYGIGDACVMAINAGADMLAICAGIEAIYEGHAAVSRAVESGTISEQRIQESIDRITAVRNSFESPLAFDNDRLNALSDRIAEFASRLK
jgi:beta-N-acetylhexosaminidase